MKILEKSQVDEKYRVLNKEQEKFEEKKIQNLISY